MNGKYDHYPLKVAELM